VNTEKGPTFRWTYLALPALFLLVAMILAALFYGRLSPEVAYHFSGGSPDGWMSRNALMAWLIAPQFALFIFGAIVIGSASFICLRLQLADSTLLGKIMRVMGNMVVLPQIIFIYAILDILLYNVYDLHLFSVWVFALFVMIAGVIVLGIFFLRAFRQSRE